MENFSEGQYPATIRDEDRIHSNTGTGRVAFISAVDIAGAALAALMAATALNSDFILTGDESISYDRVAELISQACGRPISHTHFDRGADGTVPPPRSSRTNREIPGCRVQTIAEGADVGLRMASEP
jgi:uncharacterized protein YbjT (DUF2867 family)